MISPSWTSLTHAWALSWARAVLLSGACFAALALFAVHQLVTCRSMEEEWQTLMFFAQVVDGHNDESEKLCIFGEVRARRGAELKVGKPMCHNGGLIRQPGHVSCGTQAPWALRSW